MRPRAAWWLERLGFPQVYDYVPGKMDWLSFSLPHEGSALLAGGVVEAEVPLCPADTRLAQARRQLAESGASFCIATGDGDLVPGVVQVTRQSQSMLRPKTLTRILQPAEG
jgi:hypothetical protein